MATASTSSSYSTSNNAFASTSSSSIVSGSQARPQLPPISTKKRPAPPSSTNVATEPSKHRSSMQAGSSSQAAVPKRPEEVLYFEDDYREDILAYMTSMDNATLSSAELMDMQPELQWFMRPYLIDFLVEVHQQFRLRPEVLYLAMNIVDRYVSKRVVYKKHYQLVGCASLWIAAKFEDGKDKVPLVRELADMCCKAYDESAFIQMEGHVLSTIGWVIGHPSAEAWLRVYTQGENAEEAKVQHIARFLMEITLFHREFVGIQSSFVAQGALLLARFICGKPRRSVSKYDNIAVRIAFAIDKHFAEKLDNISEIVIRKYTPTYYARASTLVREWYLSGRRFVLTPESPVTPVSASLITPGLQPSGSWPGKRCSWMSGSPSNGSISCSSSEAGDDTAPLTPITPVGQHESGYPFSMSAKENVAPPSYGGVSSSSSTNLAAIHTGKVPNHQGANMASYAARGPLHPIQPTETLPIPNRNLRRLSN